MTPSAFEKLALKIAGAIPGEHMGHRDFRLRGKIFATLGYPDADHGMVKLTPDQQKIFLEREPNMFGPCNGTWGRQGSTFVRLENAKAPVLRKAIRLAAQNVSPQA
jgi:hypothetical protein